MNRLLILLLVLLTSCANNTDENIESSYYMDAVHCKKVSSTEMYCKRFVGGGEFCYLEYESISAYRASRVLMNCKLFEGLKHPAGVSNE